MTPSTTATSSTERRSNVTPFTTRGPRWLTAGLAATAMVLTQIGLSGIGDKAGGPDYLLQFLSPRTVTENTMRRGFAPEAGESR